MVKKTLKKYFVPHVGNQHRPHFLREKSVITTALLAVILFFASMFGNHVVRTSPQLASIKSAFLVDLTNKDRAKEGLPQLVINDNLVTAATMKATDMASKEYFSHQSPDGRMPWDFIKATGYNYVYAGENLAVNFYDSGEVERAWMDSPTHKKNIMNNRYTEIGIAVAPGRYKDDDTTYVVQMFGRPKGSASVPSESITNQKANTVAVADTSNMKEPKNVLGEETSVKEVVVLASESPAVTPVVPPKDVNNDLMEFSDPEATPAELSAHENDNSPMQVVPAYTNWFERLVVSPSSVVQDLYMVLFAIVVFSLILKIFVEIRMQHPKNIAYGLLLLIIIFGFMQMNTKLVGKTEVALQTISE